MKQTYKQRVKQRILYFRIGMSMVGLGVFLLAFTIFLKQFQFLKFSMFSTICGGILAMKISRVGWSQIYWRDLIFNQLSIVVTILGISIVFLSNPINSLGAFLTFGGIILIGLGNKFHSPIPVNELPQDSNLQEWW